ncbi:MAG: M28 family peptidase, partial [Thermoguttaceae bacterium]
DKNAAYRSALESITSADLSGYVNHLADVKMEGREAGTRGGRAAGDYLMEQFAKFNLRPAGNKDGFEQPFPPNYRNILGMIPGDDPQLKNEVIVVCAHYDHVGYGSPSTSLGQIGKVHPGADDNASGTSALLELAKAFGRLPGPPKRSVLVAAFDAEEKGLFGSKYWVSHPTVPLEKIVACIDLDMIGRLRNDQLYIYGVRSGCGWRRLLSRQNDNLGLQLDFSWEFKPDADYYPFYEKGIAVLLLHTGLHENYHRPSDTADLINCAGMSRVVRLLFGTVYELAESDERIAYRKAGGRETPEMEKSIASQIALPANRLGVTMDAKPSVQGGVNVLRVAANSAADKAGLKPGDRIVQCAGREIQVDDDLIGAITTAESPVVLALKHKGEEKIADLSVELPGQPLHLGIVWRVDEAEPGTIILTHVVPGTPAARAGLQAGDRIYQVAGRDFADETAFVEMLKTQADPFDFLVDRDGKLRTVIIQLKPAEVLKRAA